MDVNIGNINLNERILYTDRILKNVVKCASITILILVTACLIKVSEAGICYPISFFEGKQI